MKNGIPTLYWVVMLAGIIACGCSGDKSTDKVGVTIRNDVQDKEYNNIEIDQLVTTTGQGSYKVKLSPGEEVSLPFEKVLSFRVTREYPDHDKVYLVKCPMNLKKPVTMKLLDIHTGKISGGCRLAQKGVRVEGGWIKWD